MEERVDQNLESESRRLNMDFDVLKSGGFIKQTQEGLFTVRLQCPGGKLTSRQLNKAADIADKYGEGEVHTSFRQSIEVPYVHYRHFDAVAADLKELDWAVASCGPRIRVPTACAGCTYNPNGLMDTQSLCLEVNRRYFGTATGHHKFKTSFSGCPIDCARSRGMDLGFQGIVEPKLVEDLCNACGLCVTACTDKALTMVDDLPVKDIGRCIYCGDCIKICPVDAMIAERKGWLARVGGKHGRHPMHAYEVAQFLSDEDCCSLIEKTIEWYRVNAEGRERIGGAISRLGLAGYLDEVVRPLGLDVVENAEDRKKYWTEGNFYN